MLLFTASDGAEIAYRQAGAGRPLLLLHGLTANSRLFDEQVAGLAASFRLIIPDFRGHGQTEGVGELTVERLALDVAELIRHLDLSNAIGVGWSLGAMVLWQVLMGPEAERFDGAVVVDMTARVANDEGWRLGLLDPERRMARPDESWSQRCGRIAQSVVAEGFEEERAPLIERLSEEMAACDPGAVGMLGMSLAEQDFRDTLPKIQTPTLVAYGARSQYYAPETSAFLARTLPNGRCIRFEKSGHSPHLEQPELFNSALCDFAASLPRARQTQAT